MLRRQANLLEEEEEGTFSEEKRVQTRRYVNIIISDVVKMIIMIKSNF